MFTSLWRADDFFWSCFARREKSCFFADETRAEKSVCSPQAKVTPLSENDPQKLNCSQSPIFFLTAPAP